ncbi:MAG TPA: circularly permuted type 2 ATP-grasp protein [Solirubrobacterales bacterium]|nr:circularly permuted type 2 ATP-grasp protein [Solirubrobacterales bacterium]
MATTLNPARPFPGAGVYPLDSGHFDEAFAKTGTARPPYATVIDALARHDLVELRERVRSNIEEIGLSFGPGNPMVVDPVPRVIDATEWEALEAGLLQRARALNAFLLDAYGDQRIFEEGIVPRRLLETSQGYEPLMRGLLDPGVPPATVAGMDLIRDAEGELMVLEDNLRMPSGAAYAIAVREVVGPEFGPEATAGLRRPDGYVARLGEAIRAAAPSQHAAEPAAAILSDGPESGAYYEHERLARELGLPVVTPGRLSCTRGRLHAQIGRKQVQIDVIYRRLDEDRLSDRGGALTELGKLLAPALRSGRLRCVNAIGTGLADDKLAHAYVAEMIRFYLGEEPLLRSVPSYDLSDPEAREEVMGRLDELVIKPRDGFGGHGVTIMPLATEGDRRKTIGLVRRRPERFVAQELVPLSTHPTVVGAGIAPRRVDLRPYVVSPAAGEASVMQGGLTRYAKAADEMVVNSSQGGGSKDTWVLGPPADVV